jgi:hypothetical protein
LNQGGIAGEMTIRDRGKTIEDVKVIIENMNISGEKRNTAAGEMMIDEAMKNGGDRGPQIITNPASILVAAVIVVSDNRFYQLFAHFGN